MAKITKEELSNSLLDYLKNVGKTEEEIIELIKKHGGSSDSVEKELNSLKNDYERLSDKILDVLSYLELDSNSEVDSGGYWYDSLTTSESISNIEGLKLDTDRRKIMGAPGSVTFKRLDIPFICDRIRYVHELDDNFIEFITSEDSQIGSDILILDKYSYEIK